MENIEALEQRIISRRGHPDKIATKCREVFLLNRVEEMSNAEIGRELGISVKTVENQITRAMRTLRRQLRGYL